MADVLAYLPMMLHLSRELSRVDWRMLKWLAAEAACNEHEGGHKRTTFLT